MKSAKLSVLMVGLVLLFGSVFGGVDQTFAQEEFIRGDADGDCLVGLYDPGYLMVYLFSGGPVPPCMDAGDANDNGSVNLGDATYLLNYLFVGGPAPLPPFPLPGTDPTEPDGLTCLAECVPIDPTPSPVDFLTAGDALGSRGETGVVVAITAVNDQDLFGYQIFLDYDENILEATDVDITGTATGDVDPDYFQHHLAEGEVEIVCIVDGDEVTTIPAGTNELVKIIFSVKPDAPLGTTILNLDNVIGMPYKVNLFTYAGGKLYPTLTDGDFTVVQHEFIRGDADGDCLVGYYDPAYIMVYLFSGGPEPPCMDAGDVNDDGSVLTGDATYLLNYLFLGGPAPAPPFPLPGTDPTEPDGLTCLAECVPVDPTPSPVDFLIAGDAWGSRGETGVVVAITTVNDQDLFGYQIFLDYDENILEATAVETTGTATGEAEANLFEIFINDTEGEVEIACIVDGDEVISIPAGTNELVKIIFSVKPDAPLGTTVLDLDNVIDVPFKGNLFTYAGGKLYPTLTDGNFTVPDPSIASITDVGNDQGKQVRVEWYRCYFDSAGSPVTITEYSLWRRIGEDKGDNQSKELLSSNLGMLAGGRLYPPGDWDFIKTVPARGESTYNTVCPTLGDSTEAEGMYWSVFFVSAMTSDPLIYYDSEPDSGYSLDNIPPLPITDLDIPRKTPTALILKWVVPGEYPGEQPATAYDIRYSTSPIGPDTTAWWDAAIQCEGEPYPVPAAGQIDSFMVTLDLTQTNYIAMKLLDDRPNYSEISNIVRFTCGDANGSGDVNLADAVYLGNWLFIGGPPPDPMAPADANCSGDVNYADMVYIVNWLFIGGPPPCSP